MSYEYKEEVKELVYNNLDKDLNKAFDIRDEVNHVYAQAAKAEEYEVKAKAFDEIFKLYIGYEDGWIHFPKGNRSFIEDIINVCKKYEIGDHS